MKTATHENMQIENFERFYTCLHKQHSEILGAEWDSKKQVLNVSYEDNATELNSEELKNLQIPTLLRFRKKLPQIDVPNVTVTSENEFQIETFDAETSRKTVREKYPEFEEAK